MVAALSLFIQVVAESHPELLLLGNLLLFDPLLLFVLVAHDGTPFIEHLLLSSDWQMAPILLLDQWQRVAALNSRLVLSAGVDVCIRIPNRVTLLNGFKGRLDI